MAEQKDDNSVALKVQMMVDVKAVMMAVN